MAYNYGPPGAYGAQQAPYSYPGAPNAPGMGAPGFPPGIDAASAMTAHSPAGTQNQFQPPANMPNINFNAPVIRLGMGEQGAGGNPADRLTNGQRGPRLEGRGSNAEPLGSRRDRLGLGANTGGDRRDLERDRAAVRESMMATQPPTREEVARTIFVGGLGDGAPNDEAIESILRCAGKLRRWTRARDSDDKLCKFGFAEYEDVDSLEAANEIFGEGIEVPTIARNGAALKTDEGEPKMIKLLVFVDEQSKKYIAEWKSKSREDADGRQFRIDGCKEDFRQTVTGLLNAAAFASNAVNGQADGDMAGDVSISEATGDNNETVGIPASLDDELSDIPPEMRATVAAEIKNFRDRSNRRDLDRLEEIEQADRLQNGVPRVNRLASPPPSGAPLGPASAANGIPVGPRDRSGGVQGAPSGPRGYRGAQLPSDYVNGVAFVGANGVPNGAAEDEDSEEPDDVLEARRQQKRDEEAERAYTDLYAKLQTQGNRRAAAQDREKARDDAQKKEQEKSRSSTMKRFAEWDDDYEAKKRVEEYYADHKSWLARRAEARKREQADDERDRAAEEREQAEERKRAAELRGQEEDFLNNLGDDLARKAAEQQMTGASGFKISLGSAAARNRVANMPNRPAPNRAMADVEGLLDDEEDAAASGFHTRPELKPLTDDSSIPLRGADMTDEERQQARQELAAIIPTNTEDLFAYSVKFNFLTPAMLSGQIRPFVEKKVVEYLGIQEDLVVDIVIDGLRDRKDPEGMVSELEEALEDEGEVLLKKVWRMVIFWTESEARGLI